MEKRKEVGSHPKSIVHLTAKPSNLQSDQAGPQTSPEPATRQTEITWHPAETKLAKGGPQD